MPARRFAPARYSLAAALAVSVALAGCTRGPVAGVSIEQVPAASAPRAAAPTVTTTVQREIVTSDAGVAVSASEAIPDEVIVRFKGEARALPGATQQRALGLNNTYIYSIKANSRYAVQAVEDLEDADDIDYVEPNYVYHAVEADPLAGAAWGVGAIQAPAAWSRSRGDGVKVAVVDTGVNAAHPDLAGRVGQGYDMVNNDNDPSDDHGHGTHVAGTIAAVAGNGLGVAGVAPGATIIPVKVLNAKGQGTNDTIASGILKAAALGARVINMSLGGPDNSETMRRAIAQVQAQGVVVIAAAGNDNVSTPFYPAANDGVIAVAATDPQLRKADFSNYGDYVDIAAPGTNIVSTGFKGDYVGMSGTSMASPHVAGAAALLLGAHGQLKAPQIQRLMQISGAAASGFAMATQPRVLNIAAAFDQVGGLDLTPPSRVIGLTASPGAPGEIELAWAPASDNVAVAGYRLYRDNEVLTTVGTTSYTDRGLLAGKAYAYRVVAFDIDGNESPTSSAVAGISGAPSGDIIGLAVTKRASNSLTLSWKTASPMRTQLQWGENVSLGKITPIEETAGTEHSVTLTGLGRFKQYHFRVKATATSGAAQYSETKKGRTKLWWLFSVQ